MNKIEFVINRKETENVPAGLTGEQGNFRVSRGPEIAPIFHSAPKAASNDECLYPLLALVDALRTGKARERKMAEEALSALLTP